MQTLQAKVVKDLVIADNCRFHMWAVIYEKELCMIRLRNV